MIQVINRVIKATAYAIKGVYYGFYTKKNLAVMALISVVAALAFIFLNLSAEKAALIVLSCVLIIIVEIINTAVEELCDMLHPKFDRRIGLVKDMMGGAVFISVLLAIVIAVIVLWHPLMDLLKK